MITRTVTPMLTEQNADAELAQLRLLQLLSPNLPVGAFSYSQGLEWAVESGWVNDLDSLKDWMQDILQGQMQYQELPLLAHMFHACQRGSIQDLQQWNHELIAFRETSELRAEESNRGRALAQVLLSLQVVGASDHLDVIQRSQHAGFAWACHAWHIELSDCLRGFAWGWLENTVLAAVKTVPLGQSNGQQVLFELGALLPAVVHSAIDVPDQLIGYASPAIAFASSSHETQYTRLYRS